MPKNHNALPVPTPEVLARPVGKLAYTCPTCGQSHPFKAIHWRRLEMRCVRCHTKFQIGLGFSVERGADAYLMGKWNSYTANRLNPRGTPYDGAKVYGSVEWACPICHCPQRGFVAHDGCLECVGCLKPYFVSVLIYRLPKVSRLKLKAPFDSIVKGLNHAPTAPIQPLPAASSDSSAGTPSRSPREDS